VTRSKALQYLKWIWVIAIVLFIGLFFYRNLPEAIDYLKSIPTGYIFLSGLLVVAAKFLIVDLALLSVKTGQWHPPYFYMFTIFTVSQLGKYIPGSIWHFAARINSYKENALSNKITAQVMVIENIWMVTGATAFGVFMISIQHAMTGITFFSNFSLPEWIWTLLPWLTIILWVAGLMILDNRYPVNNGKFSIRHILILILVQTGIWAFLGGSYYLLFLNVGIQNLFLILGGYALSWIAGYVVIFAPGGIGVREFVQVALFSSIVPAEQVVIISLMHRMLYTIVEVLLGLIGFLLIRKFPRGENPISE
jgi:uncharacterized membrane protein YbhN (UPF0104 family)